MSENPSAERWGRGLENCERLDECYAAHRRALYGALGVAARVVRLGRSDADEPWPTTQNSDAAGPSEVVYKIEFLLESWVVVRVSDHPTYGLRRLSDPADIGGPAWHVALYWWSAEEQRRDGRPGDRLWPLGFECDIAIGDNARDEVTNLVTAVISALSRLRVPKTA
jgi:hypothetical protein